jgi:hypothetical protein
MEAAEMHLKSLSAEIMTHLKIYERFKHGTVKLQTGFK